MSFVYHLPYLHCFYSSEAKISDKVISAGLEEVRIKLLDRKLYMDREGNGASRAS